MFFQNIYSQELPPIENFSPENYMAESQNWSISQSPEKLIYVANNKGLLEFNGARWKLYLSPNESIMRSVKVVKDRIYTGCFMEFGYWKKDDQGELFYTSLSKKTSIKLIEDEEFWNIISIDNYIVFQSLKRIYIYNVKDEVVNTIDSKNTITNIFKVNQSVYFQKIHEGIFKIEFGKAVLLFDDELVKSNEIINIFPNESELLILTRDKGFYRSENDLLLKWNITSDEELSKMSIYDGIRLKDKSFVLGTISNGLMHLNKEGGLLYQINQSKGILNNTILSLYEDLDNNIWLGLDNSISYINLNSPFKVFNDDKRILGSVYASAIHDGYLYLGTNQGLFYKRIESNNDFSFIEGTRGQVWSLKVIDKTLFCGHHLGTFIIEGYKAVKLPNTRGTWKIAKLNENSNLLLQGSYDGLYLLEKTNNSYKLNNKIKNFNNSSRYFETMDNRIFVNHEYKGVFKITTDSSFSKVVNVTIDTLLKGSDSGILKYNGELLYAYVNGVFKYDSASDKFTKDSILSKVYSKDEYVSGKLTVDEKNNNLWIFTNSNISFITPGGLTNTPKIRSIPLTKALRKDIVGYENVLRFDDNNKYLFGVTNGYLTVDINKLRIRNFQVHIESVIKGSNKKNNEAKELLNKNSKGNFTNNENNLEISYYTPEFNKFLKPNYQYQLLGIYEEWSAWSENSNALFENLPFGDYTFKVRTKVGDTISNNIATYSFNIAKPWYLTNLMIAIYVLSVLFFSMIMHNAYKRYYSKQRQKLIDDNKRALDLAEVQNEKKIIKIKNERLEKDFKNKSKELAASTMSIVKKNELLAEVKNQLIGAVETKESIMPIVNIIDKSLRNNDDWEFFKEAFNNVDRKFLKKLKKLHPNLSPNDLKLCAYLRLNLSSKEIAPLFNISSRSVEIKRYRLRKKMNLSHEINLVNYILEL